MTNNNGKLPEGWQMVQFGDVVRDVKESERNPLEAGLDRYIGLEHIEPENLHITEWGDLTQDEVSFTKRFRKGQVLFAKRRAYQRKVGLADFDGICSSDILTFEPKDDSLIPELLPFIVQSDAFFDHALDTSSGSLSPRTRWSQLKDFEFPLPPRDEQKQIAKVLLAVDVVVQSQRRLASDFALFRQRVIDDFVTKHCSDPEDIVKLDDIANITDCKHRTPKLIEEGYPMVAPGNIQWGPLSLSGCKQVTRQECESLMDHVDVQVWDLVFSRNQTFGIASYVINDQLFAIGQDTVLIQSGRLNTKSIYLLLRSRFVQRQIHMLAMGSTFKRINLGQIRKLKVPALSSSAESEANRLITALESTESRLLVRETNLRQLSRIVSQTFLSRLK